MQFDLTGNSSKLSYMDQIAKSAMTVISVGVI